MHYRVESESIWHTFGHMLAPKDLWNEILDGPGMRSLIIEEGKRRDGRRGYIRVTVEPSVRVHPGVYFRVNDHYEVASKEGGGCSEILDLLEEVWAASRQRSEEIIRSLAMRI